MKKRKVLGRGVGEEEPWKLAQSLKTQDFIREEILRFSCFFLQEGYNTKEKVWCLPVRQSFEKWVIRDGKRLETGKKSYDAFGFL